MSDPSSSQYFKNCNANVANLANANTITANDVNKNVTSNQVGADNENTVKSKYFKMKKASLAPWVTTDTTPTNIKTKSLSQKIKCISENMLHSNTNIVVPNTTKSNAETVISSTNSNSEIKTYSELENVTETVTSSKSDLQRFKNTKLVDVGITSKKATTLAQKSSKKGKKKRFDGVPESEILQMSLPDLICPNLDLLIVGINPGLETAYRKHYYAGPGNHFWQCMFLGGVLPHAMTAEDDASLLDKGVGFTNVVARTTRGQADLTKKELLEGCVELREKIERFKPKIVAFNGKYIFELFSGNNKFSLGLQPGVIAEGIETFQFVMPSSSARCSHLPRAQDKVPFFKGLKKMLDLVRGDIDKVEDEDVKFPLKLTTAKKRTNAETTS